MRKSMPVIARERMFYIRGKISCAPRFSRLCGDFAFLSYGHSYNDVCALLFCAFIYRAAQP